MKKSELKEIKSIIFEDVSKKWKLKDYKKSKNGKHFLIWRVIETNNGMPIKVQQLFSLHVAHRDAPTAKDAIDFYVENKKQQLKDALKLVKIIPKEEVKD